MEEVVQGHLEPYGEGVVECGESVVILRESEGKKGWRRSEVKYVVSTAATR